jgi:hypothetical protein
MGRRKVLPVRGKEEVDASHQLAKALAEVWPGRSSCSWSRRSDVFLANGFLMGTAIAKNETENGPLVNLCQL